VNTQWLLAALVSIYIKVNVMRRINEIQEYDLDRNSVGAIGGEPVWDLVNSFEALYDQDLMFGPYIDCLIQSKDGFLIPKGDLIVLLGIAALKELENKPGVVVQ
jgi:hypothetical protein